MNPHAHASQATSRSKKTARVMQGNAGIPTGEGPDYAYRILSVWELKQHIPLAALQRDYGFESAPRGLVYLPKSIDEDVAWDQQTKVLNRMEKVAGENH